MPQGCCSGAAVKSTLLSGRLRNLVACRYTLATMEYLTEHAFQYKGSDWAAMVFTFTSLYLLGNKSRTGFLMGIIANIFWFTYGYLTGSAANMFCSSVVIYLQARGWFNWAEKDAPEETLNF